MIFSDHLPVPRLGWAAAARTRTGVLVLAMALTACGASNGAPGNAPAPRSATGAASPATAAATDPVRYPYTEADIHFMSAMIGHHAQAIEMSRLAPTRAGSNSVETLARRIISSQEDEIVTMQQWLRDRQQPVPQVTAEGRLVGGDEHAMHDSHAMHGGHGGHHANMPGMLTEAQIQQLAAARGAEFDRLFLTYMIQHHRGAVSMVEDLFSSYGAGQDEIVFKFASDVNVDQITEIARMQRMLIDLLVASDSP